MWRLTTQEAPGPSAYQTHSDLSQEKEPEREKKHTTIFFFLCFFFFCSVLPCLAHSVHVFMDASAGLLVLYAILPLSYLSICHWMAVPCGYGMCVAQKINKKNKKQTLSGNHVGHQSPPGDKMLACLL